MPSMSPPFPPVADGGIGPMPVHRPADADPRWHHPPAHQPGWHSTRCLPANLPRSPFPDGTAVFVAASFVQPPFGAFCGILHLTGERHVILIEFVVGDLPVGKLGQQLPPVMRAGFISTPDHNQ